MADPKDKSRIHELTGTTLEPLDLTTEEFITLDKAKAGTLVAEEAPRLLFDRRLITRRGTITATGRTILSQGYALLGLPEEEIGKGEEAETATTVDHRHCSGSPYPELAGMLSKELYAEVIRGLARMEDHKQSTDGTIEAYGLALCDSWPIEHVLEELYELAPSLRQEPIQEKSLTEEAVMRDVPGLLACLAGRMFLAGRESVAR